MEISIENIPSTIEEFIALRDKIATTCEGGAVMFALAMILFGKDKKTGLECFTISAEKSRLTAGETYKGFSLNKADESLLLSQLEKNVNLGNSYVLGTGFETGYTLPSSGPFKFEVTDNTYSGDKASGKYKVFIRSTGADTPRPITMAVNDKGLWKAYEWSSMIVGVKAAKKIVSDDL